MFKTSLQSSGKRPDGLIVVTTGKRTWTAIVEAKVGSSNLDAAQVEAYLEIARDVGADAVITMSNQFVTVPTHHPVTVSKSKLRSVGLYHWSWTFLLTEALLHEASRSISDSDQAFILREMVRYLEHDSSGIRSFQRMPRSWGDLCGSVQHGEQLSKNSSKVQEGIDAWHELTRYMVLKMSVALGEAVDVKLSRAHKKMPEQRKQDDATDLASSSPLTAVLDVPNAASNIGFSADLARRTLTTSMVLEAPKDRKRARSVCTWIYKQIAECPDGDVLILAKLPGSKKDTVATLDQMRENRDVLLANRDGVMPWGFEVRRVLDLGGRFRGAKTFVEEAERALPSFYANVGQRLQAWVAPAPKIRSEPEVKEEVDGEESGPIAIGGGGSTIET